jgi:uncharacterized membrane protein YheB (UPF0754 family)
MYYILVPIVSAAIGWFTNYIAVKMLFYPKDPRRILGITFQGVFPKRQGMIAEKIGRVVAEELLSVNDLKEKVITPDSMEAIYNSVENKMDSFLEGSMEKKFPIMSLLTSRSMKMKVRDEMLKEVRSQLPNMLDDYVTQFEANVDIAEMISSKFSQLSTDRLETVMNDILSKEFRFIEVIGAVIGFVIGLAQVGMFLLSGGR